MISTNYYYTEQSIPAALKNIQIFENTLQYIEEHQVPSPTVHIYIGGNPPTVATGTQAFVSVINASTFEAARSLAQEGLRPFILDMANKLSPGGSVLEGSGAQEETLCRQSNLYAGLQKATESGYFPIPETGGILVRNVVFFRDDNYEFLATPFEADVFVSAAYDCNPKHKPNPENRLAGYDRPEQFTEYEEGTKAKIRTMLLAAKENGNDSLVLGAFGCGAYRNDPVEMSRWYKEVLEESEFQNAFSLVIFAINRNENFEIFRDILKK